MHDSVRSVYCTNEVTMCHGSILWHVMNLLMINAYSDAKTQDFHMDEKSNSAEANCH